MFVGYEIKQNQNQAKPIILTSDIKLSQAVLDPASGKGNKKEPVCLVAEYNKKQFILAVLDPNQTWQSPLDLMFAAGTEVKFFVRGSGTVHLTGYEHFDDIDDMSVSMSSDEDIEDISEEDEEPVKKKIKEEKKVSSAKKASPAKLTNGTPKSLNGKKNGKPPQVAGDEAEDDDDEDDESDLDFDGEDSDDDDADLDDENEDDDDDDDDLDDDDLDEDMLEEFDGEDDDDESD